MDMHRNASRLPAEWTCIATRAVSRCACRAQVPNPFVAKCFGFPDGAWARQIYLLSERTLERASDGAPGRRSERPTLPDNEWVTDRGLRCMSFPVIAGGEKVAGFR
jgi:hypothetical protein